MRIFKTPVVYCNFIFILVSGHVTSDYDAPQEITFYHDIENGEEEAWILRDKVKFHSINTGSVDIPQQQQLLEEIVNKAKESNAGLYRLKSVVKTSKKKEYVFYSFMKMDTLIKAGFLTSTIVHLDQSGSVICVKLYPKKINRSPSVNRNNSTVTFKGSEQGPVPDLTSYVLKLEHERAAKEKLAGQDNRSFLSKYWMYIVPLVIFVILSGSNGDPGASNQQQSR
ncbi:unnamed protein product [Nezara viridula]|uniref:ER membrane protein complex subunit 10 n=1 Tax=Nezara viridula TaxID=85310 RepID=A0A9P0E4D1_NEZVI|nr:unnamed protein product [Nezara viridula]